MSTPTTPAETYKDHAVENGVVALGAGVAPDPSWGKTRFISNLAFLEAAADVDPETPLGDFLRDHGYDEPELSLMIVAPKGGSINHKVLAAQTERAGMAGSAVTVKDGPLATLAASKPYEPVTELSLRVSGAKVGALKTLLTSCDYLAMPPGLALHATRAEQPQQQAHHQPMGEPRCFLGDAYVTHNTAGKHRGSV